MKFDVLTVIAVLSSVCWASSISPLVIPPSLYWDGDDGRWSSFFISVGSPAQNIRVLPGTSAEACTMFYAVIPIGCNVVNPNLTDCAHQRGGLFQSNDSTSWSTGTLDNDADGAIYTLPLVEENALGIAANASYGFDTVSLGLNNDLPTLQHSLIAGIWTDDFFLGTLLLSPWPTNFSFEQPLMSPLGQLRNNSQIPSLSYGYTAGAFYQDPTTSKFASLTLGGYDQSRFTANGVSFAFGSDISRDLLLKLDSIEYDTIGSSPLLTSSINVFIDSLVSELWLPISVCDRFRTAFNLTYDAPYYLVDSAAHSTLLKQNPKFTFHLSNGSAGVNITLPYAAFDLNLTAPLVGNETGYFPIRQAQNESQFVLGRTFLQESYIIVDYERRNFSVNQAVFPSTSVSSDIVTIEVVGGNTTGSRSLGSAAIAGIAVGAVVAVVFVAAIVVFRRRSKRLPKHEECWSDDKTDLEDASILSKRMSPGHGAHEMANDHRNELANTEARSELSDEQRLELDGAQWACQQPARIPRHELYSSDLAKAKSQEPVELQAW